MDEELEIELSSALLHWVGSAEKGSLQGELFLVQFVTERESLREILTNERVRNHAGIKSNSSNYLMIFLLLCGKSTKHNGTVKEEYNFTIRQHFLGTGVIYFSWLMASKIHRTAFFFICIAVDFI